MRSPYTLDRIASTFDDHGLIADAGLLLPATLAQHLGLRELFDRHVDLGANPGRANAGDKALTLVMSALAGGDCIDDADALRAGGTAAVLGHEVRAPSTLGTFLRSFSFAHARQLDVVSRELLRRAWAAGAGPAKDAPLTIDLDSTICETYGLQKEGGRHFTYTHVRGYHPLLAVAAGLGDVLHSRLRGGRSTSARGAASFLRETFARVRDTGFAGALVVRADSGFYSAAVVRTCRKADARFSITVRLHAGLRARIEALPERAWAPIPYWQEGGADVAELTYRPFAHDHPADAQEVRLIVRRVRPSPNSQLALFTPYGYHAFITDREGAMLALEADHRRHAEVENTVRDLKYGVGLDHLPSGRFGANAAWLALQVVAHNLARWTGRIGLGGSPITTKTRGHASLGSPGVSRDRRVERGCTCRGTGRGPIASRPRSRPCVRSRSRSRPDERPGPRPRTSPCIRTSVRRRDVRRDGTLRPRRGRSDRSRRPRDRQRLAVDRSGLRTAKNGGFGLSAPLHPGSSPRCGRPLQ